MKSSSLKPGLGVDMIKFSRSGNRKKMSDTIPAELLLEIILNGSRVCTISCLPLDLVMLGVGYLINHGYVKDFSSLNLVRECGQAAKEGILSARIEALTGQKEAPKIREAGFIPSGCGSIDDFVLQKKLKKIKPGLQVSASTLLELNLKALESQQLKKQFGGLHSAALFDFGGRLLISCEDIGRHNCIDKVAGHMYINHIGAEDKIIFTTGRLSLDAIYKLSRVKVPVAVTNSSVTHSAVKLAEKINMAVAGYARGGRFNLYCGQERIGK
ncbi:MAG: formate dehydrogenase accessory sulfurtransferase FdhD [Actinomycetota bacterium]